MKKVVFSIMLIVVSALCADDTTKFTFGDECEFDRSYVSAGAGIMLSEGGGSHDVRRLGGAAMRTSWYLSEFWAVECELGVFEDNVLLGVDALWHWWGYERFDPFFNFGACGIIGSSGEIGPKLGTGFFYHLTEKLSLRFDAGALLGLEDETEIVYTLTTGVQISF